MASKHLRKRATWQDYSEQNAGVAERNFHEVFSQEFEGTEFSVRPKPKEFKEIYVNVELTEQILARFPRDVYRWATTFCDLLAEAGRGANSPED